MTRNLISTKNKDKESDPTANLTFNLKLTDAEKNARESVVLPYTYHLKKEGMQTILV